MRYLHHIFHHGCDEEHDDFVKLKLNSLSLTMGLIKLGDESFDQLCPITGIIKSLGVVTFPITGLMRGVVTLYLKISFSKANHGHDALNLDHSKSYHEVR